MSKKFIIFLLGFLLVFSLTSCKTDEEKFLDDHMGMIIYDLFRDQYDINRFDDSLEIKSLEYTMCHIIKVTHDEILGQISSDVTAIEMFITYKTQYTESNTLYAHIVIGTLNDEDTYSAIARSNDKADYDEAVSLIIEKHIETDEETNIIENITSGLFSSNQINSYISDAIKLQENLDDKAQIES